MKLTKKQLILIILLLAIGGFLLYEYILSGESELKERSPKSDFTKESAKEILREQLDLMALRNTKTVKLGNYTLKVEEPEGEYAYDEPITLMFSRDGKHFEKAENFSSTDMWWISIYVDGDEAIVFGADVNGFAFMKKTKNGKDFYDYHPLPSHCDEHMTKAFGKYVLSSYDSNFDCVSDDYFTDTRTAFYISDDLKHWKPLTICFSGKFKDECGDVSAYDDSPKGNICARLDVLGTDDKYLYLAATFGHDGDDFYPCDWELIRVKNFSYYEKMPVPAAFGWRFPIY